MLLRSNPLMAIYCPSILPDTSAMPCLATRSGNLLPQGEQASVHYLFEKHLQPDFVLGFERFWRCAVTPRAGEK